MSIRTRARSVASVAKLRESLEKERPRVAQLLTKDEVSIDPIAVQEALDALRLQHEELMVADEELREQVDELTRLGLALEAERERYADLFSLAPDALLVTDRKGVIHEANDATAEMLRIKRRFLRAKPLTRFVTADGGDELDGVLERVHDTPVAIVLKMRPRGGGEVMVDAHIRATSRGRNLLWMLRETIVTTATDPDRALRDKTELLERERRMRIDLERSNRAKDRFIAVLAHDLRSPLNAILGWTQLLLREHMDSHGRTRALTTIERNAHAQAHLIEELLDISRLDADKLQLTLTAVDFGLLVKRAVENLLPAATEKQITLTCGSVEGLTVIGDRPRLDQVLTNLLSNGLKYTSAGGHITVTTARDGDRVRLTIVDTGKGIAPDLLPHVFDMYAQDRSPLTARRGLGIGLHIVKQLVGLHDGLVEITSDGEGLGTTVIVELPLHSEKAPAPSVKDLGEVRTLDRLHVLVVDDELDERELLANILERAGAEVMRADGIANAMALFESWRPDVLVSDISLGDGDGCALLELLRKRDANLAAIAISGFTSKTEVARALEQGFDAHLGKPLHAAELVELVDEASRARHR